MTLAYSADALIYDLETDSFALCPDHDPARHRVDIEFGNALGWSTEEAAGWNGAEDPQVAQVRDTCGVPIHAGHAYVAERLELADPDGDVVHLNMLEIEHQTVGCMTDADLRPGAIYRVHAGSAPSPRRDEAPVARGFAAGTMIATRDGDLPVEWLAPGDEILTLDGGPQPMRWIGRTRIGPRDLARHTGLAPVTITADAFGSGAPGRGLLIGSKSRVMLCGTEVEANFGLDRALARAGDLGVADWPGQDATSLTWFTLLFEQHQVILANGLWCDSLFADPTCLDWLASTGRQPPPGLRHARYALPCLRAWETRMVGTPGPFHASLRRSTAA